MPTAEDFLGYPDPWEAVRGYFSEFFRNNEREGIMHYDIIQDTDDEFQVQVSDCAWYAQEADYPEIIEMSSECEMLFFPRLLGGIGGDFKRECWLCRGDSTCDWHFYRHKTTDCLSPC